MVAFIDSIVAGVGVALLAGDLWVQGRRVLASLVGASVAVVLMAAFLAYQRWWYRVFDVESQPAGVGAKAL
jgi:hypothetical protein